MNNINEILNKIKDVDYDRETCIAELINYNPEVNFVEPMEQMSILRQVCRTAEENNIFLEKNMEEIGGLGFYVKFKKINNNEEFRINDNITFEDEETKIEYQKYLDEINEYNRKIANGEIPEKDLSEIADEYKSKFKVNNKINSTYNTNNTINDKDKFDELVKKLNDNLKTSETSNLDEQIGQINNRISELEQQEKVEEIIISDLDLGNITINTTNGKISCDNMKYSDKRLYNDFPIEYSMNEIEIYDLKSCNFEECKNLFVDNLHFISDMKNDIEEKIIQEIWNWFSADFTPETLKQQFLKLDISVTICLYDGEYINLRTSWVFEEEHSDINSGYADFNVDINSKNIECTDIGFY